jgi:L-amino acid N-acyltransferase YncA
MAAPHHTIAVRPATEADMAAVRDIYAHYVLHSLATFEETPPTLDEMLMRRHASVDLGLPYLVAEARGEILGLAYAAAYRSRPAFASPSRIRSMSATASAAKA